MKYNIAKNQIFNIGDFLYDKENKIYRLKMNDRFFINSNGIIDRDNSCRDMVYEEFKHELDEVQIKKALIVANKLDKRKTINKNFFSYGFKHLIERYFNNFLKSKKHVYISNGNSIIALLLAGYNIRFMSSGVRETYQYNVEFNVSTPSYKYLSRLSRKY